MFQVSLSCPESITEAQKKFDIQKGKSIRVYQYRFRSVKVYKQVQNWVKDFDHLNKIFEAWKWHYRIFRATSIWKLILLRIPILTKYPFNVLVKRFIYFVQYPQ